MGEHVDLGRGVDFRKAPSFETTLEGVEVGTRLEVLGEDVGGELIFGGYAEGSAGGEPRDGVYLMGGGAFVFQWVAWQDVRVGRRQRVMY
jgi:hypothetical protein